MCKYYGLTFDSMTNSKKVCFKLPISLLVLLFFNNFNRNIFFENQFIIRKCRHGFNLKITRKN